MPKHKRRKLIVDSVQHRLLAGNLLYLLSVILVLMMARIAPLIQTLDNTLLSAEERDTAAAQLLGLGEGLWIALGLTVGLCVFHSIIVSHRIAGPLYRVKRSLKQLANGDFSLRVRTRIADYLVREVACINQTIEQLDRGMGLVHERYGEARGTLPRLAQALKRKDLADAEILCGELQLRLDSLGRSIGNFRTTESGVCVPQVTQPETNPTEPVSV